MKKKYINPEMEILEVEELSLLAGSLPLSDEEITGSGGEKISTGKSIRL